MVYRIFAEKKKAFANEAAALRYDVRHLLSIKSLQDVRLLNRYDAEDITPELFDYAVKTVFSEPQLDDVYACPAPLCSRWSFCPVSSTSVPIRRPSASRSCRRGSVRSSARPRSMRSTAI